MEEQVDEDEGDESEVEEEEEQAPKKGKKAKAKEEEEHMQKIMMGKKEARLYSRMQVPSSLDAYHYHTLRTAIPNTSLSEKQIR